MIRSPKQQNIFIVSGPNVCLVLLCFLFFGFVSCKHKQKIGKTETTKAVLTPDSTINEKCKLDYKSGKVLTQHLKLSELDFNYVKAKLNCQLTLNDEEHTFNVTLHCKKDSVIWLSISKMGIDGARVLITRDSVKVRIGFTEKKYFKGDFSYINQLLHTELDYDMIQALLFGNSTQFYDIEEKLKPGKDKNNCNYLLSTIRKRHALRIVNGKEQAKESYQTMWLDPTTFKILQLEFEDVEAKRKFNACYDDFKMVESYMAPFKLLYTISAEKTIRADIQYTKIGINEIVQFPFNIPANYEPIEIKRQ